MAVTLPAILLAYEVAFHPDIRNMWSRGWPVLMLGMVTIIAMVVKVMTPNQLSTNPWYVPHYDIHFVASAYLHYYRLLFLNDGLGAFPLAAALTGAFVLAILMRRSPMIFGFLFANIALIPVCVIVPRQGFVWYMPLLGYALYAGDAVSALVKRMSERPLLRPAVFAALAIALFAFHYKRAAKLGEPFHHEQDEIVGFVAAAKSAAPALPRGSRILVESDPHREVWWVPLFSMRLAYRDPTLWVDRRANAVDDFPPGQTGLYALRLRWNGSKYEAFLQPQAVAAPVTFDVTPANADVVGAIRRGQRASIRLPSDFANCTIDAAYRLPDDELTRAGVWFDWSKLDDSGTGVVRTGSDAERGRVVVDRIRACGGSWIPASASFLIDP